MTEPRRRVSISTVHPAKNNSPPTNGNVRVVVRVRPLNSNEQVASRDCVVKVVDENMLTFDPKEDDISSIGQPKRFSVLDKRIKDMHFAFDRVFDENGSNNDVFQHTTKPIIDSILDGYNCSVFAYGATSAGKTHTMLGSPQQPGVIFLTMMELYDKLRERENEVDADLTVSYLEVRGLSL